MPSLSTVKQLEHVIETYFNTESYALSAPDIGMLAVNTVETTLKVNGLVKTILKKVNAVLSLQGLKTLAGTKEYVKISSTISTLKTLINLVVQATYYFFYLKPNLRRTKINLTTQILARQELTNLPLGQELTTEQNQKLKDLNISIERLTKEVAKKEASLKKKKQKLWGIPLKSFKVFSMCQSLLEGLLKISDNPWSLGFKTFFSCAATVASTISQLQKMQRTVAMAARHQEHTQDFAPQKFYLTQNEEGIATENIKASNQVEPASIISQMLQKHKENEEATREADKIEFEKWKDNIFYVIDFEKFKNMLNDSGISFSSIQNFLGDSKDLSTRENFLEEYAINPELQEFMQKKYHDFKLTTRQLLMQDFKNKVLRPSEEINHNFFSFKKICAMINFGSSSVATIATITLLCLGLSTLHLGFVLLGLSVTLFLVDQAYILWTKSNLYRENLLTIIQRTYYNCRTEYSEKVLGDLHKKQTLLSHKVELLREEIIAHLLSSNPHDDVLSPDEKAQFLSPKLLALLDPSQQLNRRTEINTHLEAVKNLRTATKTQSADIPINFSREYYHTHVVQLSQLITQQSQVQAAVTDYHAQVDYYKRSRDFYTQRIEGARFEDFNKKFKAKPSTLEMSEEHIQKLRDIQNLKEAEAHVQKLGTMDFHYQDEAKSYLRKLAEFLVDSKYWENPELLALIKKYADFDFDLKKLCQEEDPNLVPEFVNLNEATISLIKNKLHQKLVHYVTRTGAEVQDWVKASAASKLSLSN